VHVAPGNGGTPAVARTVPDLDILDPAAVARHASRERYDLVVVGPEAPLAAGVADALRRASVPVFGPERDAARLESSKAFAKQQLERAGVPTASFAVFSDPLRAIDWAARQGAPPVVKADWLAAGKGVVVPETTADANAAIHTLFAAAPPGGQVVLEQRLSGREVSVFAFVSGETVVPLAAACDYKRLSDGDVGPNTGGMGSYAPVPWFGRAEVERAAAELLEPVAWRMARDGTPYRGILYAGLMLTDAGPMVLEFNARFGDPEAQVLLPLIDGDFSAALLAVASGDRSVMEDAVSLRAAAAVGVVVAAAGYPDRPTTGGLLRGVEPADAGTDGPTLCFHAATRDDGDGVYRAAGGRLVTFVGIGADLAQARAAAYAGVDASRVDGGQHRTDIGLREV